MPWAALPSAEGSHPSPRLISHERESARPTSIIYDRRACMCVCECVFRVLSARLTAGAYVHMCMPQPKLRPLYTLYTCMHVFSEQFLDGTETKPDISGWASENQEGTRFRGEVYANCIVFMHPADLGSRVP